LDFGDVNTGPKFQKSAKFSSVCGNIIFMPEFRTVLHTPISAVRIALSDRIFTIGSCFSDVMGARFASYKLHTHTNTAGILYNPHSIHQVISLAIQGGHADRTNYTGGEPVFHYNFHSSLYATTNDELEHRLEKVIRDCHDGLHRSNWLIITYGTVWVYRRKENGVIVANCHKQPAAGFTKELLSTDDVVASFNQLKAALKTFNPDLKVILTISPVRHTKDTMEGNSVSKATLRVACDRIIRSNPDAYYFPAYEIMMDDLRDYRFYKADMIHPTGVAEDYIWEKFAGAWFNDELITFINAWKPIQQALQHRAFHASSEAHQQFLKATLRKIEDWAHLVDVEEERKKILEGMK
jgi:hypothetical protein